MANGGSANPPNGQRPGTSSLATPRGLNLFTLYYAPHTCSLASHIALEDAGAKYELKRIDFGKTEQQSRAYVDVNPKGRVPAMSTARGILTETPAILAYVAQSFPQARLAPLDDPFAFAQLQAFNSFLCSGLHVAHAHRVRGYRHRHVPAGTTYLAFFRRELDVGIKRVA